MSSALDLSTKEAFQTILFVWGGGFRAYTDRATDFVGDDGRTYRSTPNIEVNLPDNDGGLAEKSIEITIPLDAFTSILSNGAKHAPVTVTVREYTLATESGPGATVATSFVGLVNRTTRNHEGRSNLVQIEALPMKARMGVPLGVPANHECENALGDTNCKVDMGAGNRTQTGNVAAVNGKVVTITGLVLMPDRFFHRGYVEKDGLKIMVREWRNSDPTRFVLVGRPPSSWIGMNVSVKAGCDKSVETCRNRFSNEDNFLGLGYAIPAYNPNFENPG